MTIFLLGVFAYLAGSIPFGLILTRLAGLGDIRAIGSGNIGATNVLRTGRKGLALATLLLDAAKGTFVVCYVRIYDMASSGHTAPVWWSAVNYHVRGGVAAAALTVVLGHLFPVWLRFKGGKGVATGLGVFYGVYWPLGVFACAAWLAGAVLFRRSSAAALTAYGLAPFAALYFSSWQTTLLTAVISALVFYKHRTNIQRLRAGTEPKIGQK